MSADFPGLPRKTQVGLVARLEYLSGKLEKAEEAIRASLAKPPPPVDAPPPEYHLYKAGGAHQKYVGRAENAPWNAPPKRAARPLPAHGFETPLPEPPRATLEDAIREPLGTRKPVSARRPVDNKS